MMMVALSFLFEPIVTWMVFANGFGATLILVADKSVELFSAATSEVLAAAPDPTIASSNFSHMGDQEAE